MRPSRVKVDLLDVEVDVIERHCVLDRLSAWSLERTSRYVVACNVHVLVSAIRELDFRRLINGADLTVPDGAPVAWLMRKLGHSSQERLSGPDLMWALCKRAEVEEVGVYLFGSTNETLERLQVALASAFPMLRVSSESPPFRPLTPTEDAAAISRINASGAGLVFIGLGCPKQEQWMADHRGKVQAVMIGVGAAFDFHSGTLRRAPRWMQDYGLEWLHRLFSEPRRLWKRYLLTNTLFLALAAWQLIQHGLRRSR